MTAPQNRLFIADEGYPERVKTIMGERAPKHLDMVGNQAILDLPGVGFSGSRRATRGLQLAHEFAKQAAERSLTVISGNASGVDFKAHFASLEAGGNTILVIPEGIDNFRVKKDLRPIWDWDRVLVISQFQANAVWEVRNAFARNRLIVALSKAVIVFEPGITGGTLDAGKQTLKAGIPLFVAPSVIRDGDHILMSMGGRLLRSMDELS